MPKKKLNGFWKCIELGSGVFNARYVPVAVRRLAVEMGHWTGDDIESPRDFYITFFIVNLPARHGNVGKYRQYYNR